MKVFVYGTLKRGFSNNRLLDTSEFITTATMNQVKMLNIGAFPGVVEAPESQVQGELWEVPESALGSLDALEGYSEASEEYSLYLRREGVVETPEGSLVACVFYLWNGGENGYDTVDSGKWG